MRQEVEQYKTHFRTADADGNGTISMTEAQKYLTEQVGLDRDAVIAKFNEFDKDASGDLDQIEFAVMMSSLEKTTLAEGVPGDLHVRYDTASANADGNNKSANEEVQEEQANRLRGSFCFICCRRARTFGAARGQE